MKRNTINQIRSIEPIRTLKKNKTCQYNKKSKERTQIDNFNNSSKNQFMSMTVTSLFLHQFLEQLTQTFRLLDQRKTHEHLVDIINSVSLSLQSMLNPMPFIEQKNAHYIKCQQEPCTANGDILCGGNIIPSQQQINKKMGRMSFKLKQEVSKKQKSQFNNSKQVIPSKCQIKLSKDQYLFNRNGVQPLQKLQQVSRQDTFEDILRDKFIKDKKLKRISYEKPPKLPMIDEHSFDYDGTIFPIKRNSIQSVTKIKILNTTCKVLNRGYGENKKQNAGYKKIIHLKTQTSQNQKQNNKSKQEQGLFTLRRHSNTESMKELFRVCGPEESSLKTKIEQSLLSKGIKIRQLKGA